MKQMFAALIAVTSCATMAQAQTAQDVAGQPDMSILSLEQAIASAGGAAPARQAADAEVEAADANRTVAGLRPNPVLQAQVENIIGTGPYGGVQGAETTVGFMQTLELGGKRQARMAVANAQFSRTELQALTVAADVRLQVSQLYIEAVAAERRLATARDQARIANDALHAANVRVEAGRASPLEQQRADVARVTAEANVERQQRLTQTARSNLERRMTRPIEGMLDMQWLDRLPAPDRYGPVVSPRSEGTLAMAAAEADLTTADAEVRLAGANRIPNLDIGPSVRRFEAGGDMAAVFTISLPIPLFNNGRAALAQARAERTGAEARRRIIALDIEQAIGNAEAEAANAATTARATSGPALAAAQEAARIARIGYREGKFGQIDLLDAERTLADTRMAAIDALAAYQQARALLERLTTPAPAHQGEQ